jgi:hypothetical protein
VSYSELFDGEECWLEPDGNPGWVKPFMRVTDVVVCEPQPKFRTPLDPELTNIVSVPVSPAEDRSWSVEDGWSAFAVMVRYIGEILSPEGKNDLEVEQLVARDEKTWDITGTYYRVFWKGEEVEGI